MLCHHKTLNPKNVIGLRCFGHGPAVDYVRRLDVRLHDELQPAHPGVHLRFQTPRGGSVQKRVGVADGGAQCVGNSPPYA